MKTYIDQLSTRNGTTVLNGLLLLFALGAAPTKALAADPTASLVASNHNGYAISCFGGRDGAIDLTVSGGTSPFTYSWSTGATTEDVSSLAAGYYAVVVTDANSKQARGEITLTEPAQLKSVIAMYEYPNGFNASCYQCYNGSITNGPYGGVSPYGYAWHDGATTQNRSSLGAGAQQVTITDANGCTFVSEVLQLREPERSDWTMTGNAGSTPGTQYIGTTDNKDVVLKSNAAEGLRLLSSGGVRVPALAETDGYRLIGVDPQGTLRSLDALYAEVDDLYPDGCPAHARLPWSLCGNSIRTNEYLGTNNEKDLIIKTNAVERMRITADGKVGIGTTPPSTSTYKLFVEGGISTRDVLVKLGTWPDYVFKSNYALMPLADLRKFLGNEHHLPGMPSESELQAKGGFEVGDMNARILKTVEEQALYILQLEERLDTMEQRLKALEASK